MSTKSPIPLKPLDFGATAKAVEAFTQRHNVPSLSYPAAPPPSPPTQPPVAAAPMPAPVQTAARVMKRLPMEVPEYVMDALKKKASETKGASVRYVVLCALKAYGIEVRDEEMVLDRRRQGG